MRKFAGCGFFVVFIAGCSSSGTNSGSSPSPAVLTVTTVSLPTATVGSAYSGLVAVTGGTAPYVFSASGLPGGLSINGSTGAITGTPSQGSIGTVNTTVKVADSSSSTQSATSNLSIKVSTAALAFTTTSLPMGSAGTPYPSTTLQGAGGVAPYTWSLASGSHLPTGLNLSPAGILSGTPAAPSNGSVTFIVTDSFTNPETAQATLPVIISGIASLSLTTAMLPAATLNTAYSATLTAAGGVPPYTFALAGSSSLPPGLTLGSSGVISGTPTTTGSSSFSVQVTDASTPAPLSQMGTLSITVNAASASACGNMSTGNGASLNGFVPFPASNAWNTNIASAALDPNSATIISGLTGSHLHPDFSNIADGDYGIPYVVVDSNVTAAVPMTMTDYPDESDITLYPVPMTAPIEGDPADCTTNGDNHLIVIDKNKCWIYETWQTQRCNSSWSASNGAIWDLTSNEHRPFGWTSADAAGLPIFPGLVRYDEVAAGAISHALSA